MPEQLCGSILSQFPHRDHLNQSINETRASIIMSICVRYKYRQPDAHAHHHQSISGLAIRIVSALIARAALAISGGGGNPYSHSSSGDSLSQLILSTPNTTSCKQQVKAKETLDVWPLRQLGGLFLGAESLEQSKLVSRETLVCLRRECPTYSTGNVNSNVSVHGSLCNQLCTT